MNKHRIAGDDRSATITAVTRSVSLMVEHHNDLSFAVQKVCAELSTVARSNLACRVLLRCAILDGSPNRARFSSLLLSAQGHVGMARLLARHAASAGAKPWQKRRLAELMETQPDAEHPDGMRTRLSLEITEDGQIVLLDEDGHESDRAAFGADESVSGPPWLRTLITLLDREPVGIHSDVLMIEVGSGARALDALRRMLPVLRLLPVVPVLLTESAASVPSLVESLSSAVADGFRPVIAVPSHSGGYGLITAGGGELLVAGPTRDLVVDTIEELAAIASAVELLGLYVSPVLRTQGTALIESFRAEARALLPVSSPHRAFARVMRFQGSPRTTSQLRTDLTGRLISAGFFDEAHALLERAQPWERDRVHAARMLRARFATARFEEATAQLGRLKRTSADDSLVRESTAALSLLSEVEEVGQTAGERLEAIDGKVLTILHASVPDQSGGYAVRAHSILQTMAGNGFDVVAVTRPGFPEAANTLAPGTTNTVEQGCIRYLRLGTRAARGAGEYAYMRESVDHYAEVIRRERPSIIHLRSTYVSALPGLIAAKRFGLPVVYEVSGMWELVYEASNTAQMESRRARTTRLEDAVLGRADAVVTITGAMRDIIEARVSTRRPVQIVPNAVDAEEFSQRKKDSGVLARLGWEASIPVIGYIGTFVHYEGLDILLRALALLNERSIGFRALLVGDGAEAPWLRSLAVELGLDESRVHFTGRVPHTQVADLYSVIDICAYPRRLTPATRAVSPLKPFEAMASKKAVIVSDVPALAEIAGQGQRGLVVPHDSVVALADALERVIRDPTLTSDMVDAAAAWTRRERSWTAVGRVMAAALASVRDDGGHAGFDDDHSEPGMPECAGPAGDLPVGDSMIGVRVT